MSRYSHFLFLSSLHLDYGYVRDVSHSHFRSSNLSQSYEGISSERQFCRLARFTMSPLFPRFFHFFPRENKTKYIDQYPSTLSLLEFLTLDRLKIAEFFFPLFFSSMRKKFYMIIEYLLQLEKQKRTRIYKLVSQVKNDSIRYNRF